MGGSCEHGSEISGHINSRQFPEQFILSLSQERLCSNSHLFCIMIVLPVDQQAIDANHVIKTSSCFI